MMRAACLFLVAFPALAQSGSIEGVVRDATTSEPVQMAVVTLDAPFASPAPEVADSSGHFAFHGLPPGDYQLSAAKPGYKMPGDPLSIESELHATIVASSDHRTIDIRLARACAIHGRLLDEDGLPVRNCPVSAAQFEYAHGERTLRAQSRGITNALGEYRIADLVPGRYYVYAACRTALPAAHPLLPRGDPRRPHDTYMPRFYGGGASLCAATPVDVAAAADLGAIDFELPRSPAFPVRGTVEGPPGAIAVQLLPADDLLREVGRLDAAMDVDSHTFELRSVVPGDYLLVAWATHGDRTLYARRAIQVRTSPPEPVNLALSAGADLKGRIQFDADDSPAMPASITLAPLAAPLEPVEAPIAPDGTFTLRDVQPGRWRFVLDGPAYIKSVFLGGQPVSAFDFQIGRGAAPLSLTLGRKAANVNVSLTASTVDGPVWVAAVPADRQYRDTGLDRAISTLTPQVTFQQMAPGRHIFLAASADISRLSFERPEIWKALEDRTQLVDVPEEGTVNITLEPVTRQEIVRSLAGGVAPCLSSH